jgi:ribonuclease Z
MSLTYRVLGNPGSDNALFVQVDSGQSVERLLFDCGEGCVSELPFADVLTIDHLFLSHCHMDHVAGFDSFFRATFNRTTKPNHIWGPPETARILQHRFEGYLWNLHEQMSATWLVSDIDPAQVRTTRFELNEAFAVAHDGGTQPHTRIVCDGQGYFVEAVTMDHRTPTLAYIVREKPRQNVDTARLAAMGLRPGPWLKQLRESTGAEETVTIDGTTHAADELRRALFVETPGDAIAYLTDFLLDEPAMERLADALRGCRVMVCEGQYRHADLDLARKHFHMTTVLSAELARRAGVEELVLFHLSARYQAPEWIEMLREAREVFPNTHYPPHWQLTSPPCA